eukprot:NODE_349_length_10402_cov_0.251286.p10 type:complete len:103 gc:universal NODE_349_length_10402_cov_0.251286:4708-5016(+)
MGPNAWVMMASITAELLIVIKFGRGMFPRPFPVHVVIGWAIFICLLVGFAIYKFIILAAMNTPDTDQEELINDPSTEFNDQYITKKKKQSRALRKRKASYNK